MLEAHCFRRVLVGTLHCIRSVQTQGVGLFLETDMLESAKDSGMHFQTYFLCLMVLKLVKLDTAYVFGNRFCQFLVKLT